jgi:hypothetical protein
MSTRAEALRPAPVATKAALAAEVLAAYARVRLLLARRPLPETLKALRGCDASPALRETHEGMPWVGLRLAQVAIRTLEPLPTDSRCLMRSLVVLRMLARRGIDSRLVIGVQPGTTFQAHAWLEHDGGALLDPGSADFKRILEA